MEECQRGSDRSQLREGLGIPCISVEAASRVGLMSFEGIERGQLRKSGG
jgi:hypothetical protein